MITISEWILTACKRIVYTAEFNFVWFLVFLIIVHFSPESGNCMNVPISTPGVELHSRASVSLRINICTFFSVNYLYRFYRLCLFLISTSFANNNSLIMYTLPHMYTILPIHTFWYEGRELLLWAIKCITNIGGKSVSRKLLHYSSYICSESVDYVSSH